MFDFQGPGEEGKVAPVPASKTWNSRYPARCSLAWRGGSGGGVAGAGRRGGEGAGRPQSFFFFSFPYCLAGVEQSCRKPFLSCHS